MKDTFFTEYFTGQIANDFKNQFFFTLEDKDNPIPYVSWQDDNGNIVDENYTGKVIKINKTIPNRYTAKSEQDFEEIFHREFEKSKTDNIELFSTELLNFVEGMIEDHDNNFTAKERLDFISSKQTYIDFKNWLASYEVKKDETTKGIIYYELRRVEDKFTDDKAFARAVTETLKFFSDNTYRATEKIKETRSAKDAIMIAYKNITIATGRINDVPLSRDIAYVEFIKSLFSMYNNNTIEQLIKKLQSKN